MGAPVVASRNTPDTPSEGASGWPASGLGDRRSVRLDVTNASGSPVPEDVVVGWVRDRLDVAGWKVLDELLNAASEPEIPPDEPISRPQSASEHSLLMLRRLRIASVDRLVREVVRVEPRATRATVLAELEAAGKRIGWFGRAIVCVRDVP